MTRDDMAVAVAGRWTPGVCHFCGRSHDQVDGDRVRWLFVSRTVCSLPGCVRRFWIAVDQALKAARRQQPRRRSPAEIHELKLKEAKERRAAARARRKGRVA